MTPRRAPQAAIELLDEIIAAAERRGRRRRHAHRPLFQDPPLCRLGATGGRCASSSTAPSGAWPEPPRSGRAAMLGLAAAGSGAARAVRRLAARPGRSLAGGKGLHAPVLGGAEMAGRAGSIRPSTPADLQSLLDRAPLDLRVNRLRAERDELLPAFPGAVPTPLVADRPSAPRSDRRSRRARPGAPAWSRSRTKAASSSLWPAPPTPGRDRPRPVRRRRRQDPRPGRRNAQFGPPRRLRHRPRPALADGPSR